MADLKQVSKDTAYSVQQLTQRDKIGYENASGGLGIYAKSLVKNAVVVHDFCSKGQQEAIIDALPNRLVLFANDGKEHSHPHIKFLANHITRSVRNMDFSNKNIKLIGPKFDKEEVDLFKTAKSVHFCTKMPCTADEMRENSSVRALDIRIATNERNIISAQREIESYMENVRKHPNSHFNENLRSTIKTLNESIVNMELDNVDYRKEREVISSQELMTTKKICNTGAENCKHKADVVVSFDSLYDIDIKKLLMNAENNGVTEVYASMILPFGLLFFDKYYSPELDVNFSRKGSGFVMTHASDLTSGYSHTQSTTAFELMKSNFVEPDHFEKVFHSTWAYEIVRDIAEMVLLKFVKVRETSTIVRKMLPSKFDKYTMIYDPVLFFSDWPEFRPVMVEQEKLDATIEFVTRQKASKNLIEDTYAYVSGLFMKVVVGKTELQKGGTADTNMVSSIVLYALLEGGCRKHNVGMAFKRGLSMNSRGITAIWPELCHFFKLVISEMFPNFANYMRSTRLQLFLQNRLDFSQLVLDSSRSTLGSLSGFLKAVAGFYFENKNWKWKFFQHLPSLSELGYMLVGNAKPYLRRLKLENLDPRILKQTKWASGFILTMLGQDEKFFYIDEEDRCEKSGKERRDERDHIYLEGLERELVLDEELDEIEEGLRKKKEKEKSSRKTENGRKPSKNGGKKKDDTSSGDGATSGSSTVQDDSDSDSSSDDDGDQIGKNDVHRPAFSVHSRDNQHHRTAEMDDLTLACFNMNMKLAGRISSGKPLKEREQKEIREAFTREPEWTNPQITPEKTYELVSTIRSVYAVGASVAKAKKLEKLKNTVLDMMKRSLKQGDCENIGTKKIKAVKGAAGCGKTSKILEDFIPEQDAYLVKFAGVCFATNDDLKKKFGPDFEYRVKTFEKVAEMPKSGRRLNIDEAGSLSVEYILFVLVSTSYDEYILWGDDEQTEDYDKTGSLNVSGYRIYTDLVPREHLGISHVTYRYGPTVAAFLNTAYNYPVISLKRTDTALHYHNIEEHDSSVPGTNLTITTRTETEFSDAGVANMGTAAASQGLTKKRVNAILRPHDITAAVAYRGGGIVLGSRAQEELHLYIDHTSKRTKEHKNLTIMADNYATLFDVVLPASSDF